MESLRHEFAVIQAQHSVDSRKSAEIELLRILLRRAKGEYTNVHDTWRIRDIVEKYPEFAEHYDLPAYRRVI